MRGVIPLALATGLMLTFPVLAANPLANPSASPSAKPTPKAAPAEAGKSDAAKDAFLGFSEDDRKAAQSALVWLGLYNGVNDGAWGKRTGDAISAFQKSAGAKPDGVLTAEMLTALKSAAAKPREALGFETVVDAATGVQIGAPLRALQKQPAEAGHAVYASKDGATKLDLYAVAPPASGDAAQSLDGLFKLTSAETDRRKVSYKAMKAGNFFVVSGDEGQAKFYARYAVAGKGIVRGFEFRYPRAKAETFDRVAIAMSNAFDPEPAGKPASPTPSATPSASPVASTKAQLVATALVIAPGQALTALTPGECARPLVAGQPAAFGRVDESVGLARLDGDFGAGAAPAATAEADTADAFVMSRAPGASADKSVVEASRGDWTRLGAAEGGVVVSASQSARGAPVFNLQGQVIGVLAPSAKPPRRFAGVNVAEPRRAIAGAPLEAFVARAGGAAGPDLKPSEIVRRFAPRVLAVTCGA